jgi:hypothetical protein
LTYKEVLNNLQVITKEKERIRKEEDKRVVAKRQAL